MNTASFLFYYSEKVANVADCYAVFLVQNIFFTLEKGRINAAEYDSLLDFSLDRLFSSSSIDLFHQQMENCALDGEDMRPLLIHKLP